MTKFEESLQGNCSACGQRTYFDPCSSCQEVARLAVVLPSPDDDGPRWPIGTYHDDADYAPVSPGHSVFDSVNIPTPAETRRLMRPGPDDENETMSRLLRYDGSRDAARWGVDPFTRDRR